MSRSRRPRWKRPGKSPNALPPFHVKGKAAPIRAQRVGALKGTKPEIHQRALPLVGRDAELALALDALRSAVGGMGNALELVGDAGIGKSRLLQEVRARAESDGVRAIIVQCEQYETVTPFYSIERLVRTLTSQEDRLEQIAAEANRLTSERDRANDEVSTLLAGLEYDTTG